MARRVFVSEIEIEAPRTLVWDVLVDLASYPRWNPFTLEVRSSLEIGAPVDMKVRMLRAGGIVVSQREMLRALEAPELIVWGMSMLGGGVRAERRQTLTELDDRTTRYRTEDVIEGPLGALVFATFGPSVQAGFDEMARALEGEVLRRLASDATGDGARG
ncbi:MAG: SRPBCC domain-containing protein [Sandaracinaceae bacterium]